MGMFDFIPAVKKDNEAKQKIIKAKEIVTKAQKDFEKASVVMDNILEDYGRLQLTALSTTVTEFVEEFKKLKNVELDHDIPNLGSIKLSNDEFIQIETSTIQVKDIAQGGIISLSSGALAGYAAYGTVGMLATASTGTAIGTLSGAAATNATLAWLGGGSLAAGGGGMAMGTLVLGGVVALPALAIGYAIFNSKANTNLANAEKEVLKAKQFQANMKSENSKIEALTQSITILSSTLTKLELILKRFNSDLHRVIEQNGVEFSMFPENDKYIVYHTVLVASTIKSILDFSIIKNDKLNPQIDSLLDSTKEHLLKSEKYIEER